MNVHDKDGKLLADMYHMKEPGKWTGWVEVEGERISVDGFHGGRDRTFGVRVADEIDFWLWLDAGFEDRAIEAWVFETADGKVTYVDGGITHNDGSLSKRFVKIEHDVDFDGDRKRPSSAVLVFTDEDGATYRVTADAPNQHVNAYYGLPMAKCKYEDLGDGAYFIHFRWDSNDRDELVETRGQVDGDGSAHALRFRRQDRLGHLRNPHGRQGHTRGIPNWRPMDMSSFKQDRRAVGRLPADRKE